MVLLFVRYLVFINYFDPSSTAVSTIGIPSTTFEAEIKEKKIIYSVEVPAPLLSVEFVLLCYTLFHCSIDLKIILICGQKNRNQLFIQVIQICLAVVSIAIEHSAGR